MSLNNPCIADYAGVFWVAHCRDVEVQCLRAFTDLLLALSLANAKSFTEEDIAVLVYMLVIAVVGVEESLPASELGMKLHSILNIPKRILDSGPMHGVSMWSFEGMWKKLLAMRGNNAHPERTMMNIFGCLEVSWMQFASNPAAYSSQLHTLLSSNGIPTQQGSRGEQDYYLREQLSRDGWEVFTLKQGQRVVQKLTERQELVLHETFRLIDSDYMMIWHDYIQWFYDET
jgi:hypothetical protein